MFEDIEKQTGLEISRDANDRAIVYAIWTRNAAGKLPVDEAWGILHARYGDEPRFLFFNAYEELVAPHTDGAWTPHAFLDKIQRVLDGAGGRLNPEVRDLLAIAGDDLHPLSEVDAARLDRIRERVGRRFGDADAARKRLQRLMADVIRELHDRTKGGQPIRKATSASSDWQTSLEAAVAAGREPTTYVPTAKVSVGAVLEHPKFGKGIVTVIEPGRAHILFESGVRKLVVA